MNQGQAWLFRLTFRGNRTKRVKLCLQRFDLHRIGVLSVQHGFTPFDKRSPQGLKTAVGQTFVRQTGFNRTGETVKLGKVDGLRNRRKRGQPQKNKR